MIRKAITKLVEKIDLTEHEAETVMHEIMSGEANPAQISAFITALRMKGETVSEIVGFARAMRARALKVSCQRQPLVDTCGTGGDGSGTFNVSTIAALVIAGAGVAVAKHGNRSISSHCGSADMLEALGAKIDLGPDEVSRCIEEVGFGFLFAPNLHPAMKHVANIRKDIGIRTVFNILGPLVNPADVTAQLIGTYSKSLAITVADALRSLGTRRAMVVHGHNGLDELSTTGSNFVISIGIAISECELDPERLGLKTASITQIKGGSPTENAEIALQVLQGSRGPKRDIVLFNAAAGMVVSGKAPSIETGLQMAAESIDSGEALERLKAFVSLSRQLSRGAE